MQVRRFHLLDTYIRNFIQLDFQFHFWTSMKPVAQCDAEQEWGVRTAGEMMTTRDVG